MAADGAISAPSLYPDPRARKKAVAGWCLYDFANSAYTTLILTVSFSIYFREAVVNAPNNRGDELWGIASSVAMLIVALVSPVLGAFADYSGRKKFFLILTTLLSVAGTAGLFFVAPGDIVLAMVLVIVATVGFESGYTFYNAHLHEVSTPKTIGTVSGWAWAIGYVGGLLALLMCYPLIGSELKDAAGAIVPEAVRDRQVSFVLVAAFYLVFALPAFLWLREAPPQGGSGRRSGYVTIGFRRVARTVSQIRNYRETGKYVLASLFFTDGITTTIFFSASYATVTFGFSSAELRFLFLVLNIVAFPGALVAGYLADRWGAKRILIGSLLLWIGVILVGYSAQGKGMFWVMAAGAAIGMGSTQAVGRSYMAQITPPSRESEFFGFYVLSGKFASIIGPVLFGTISVWKGQRLAVFWLLPFFVIALAIMLTINDAEARKVGRSESDASAEPVTI